MIIYKLSDVTIETFQFFYHIKLISSDNIQIKKINYDLQIKNLSYIHILQLLQQYQVRILYMYYSF